METSISLVKKVLWIGLICFFIVLACLLTSAKARLIFYRLKDDSVVWASEKLYALSHWNASEEVRIVCLGDSMTDDMPEQPILDRLLICRPKWTKMLEDKLRATYPDRRVFVYNYGARSRKIATALERMEKPYEREDFYYGRYVAMPSVKEAKPDIIILESHGYMDYDTDYEEYARVLKEIIHLAKDELGSEVYLLVTICPDSRDLKKPYELYVNDAGKRMKEAQLIRKRMEDAIELGRSLGIPIIDVYHKTTTDQRPYIKEQDMVHPSYLGHVLIAKEALDAVSKSSYFTQ